MHGKFPAMMMAITCLMFVSIAAGAAAVAEGPVNTSDYKNAIKVACVGDSITYGAGIKNRSRDSYPAQLQRMLGDKWQVGNFGVSGATLLKKGDMPYDRQAAYTQALAMKPDVVVIMLGTNDSKPQNWKHKDEFIANYEAMIATFRKVNPDARIYAVLPVPAFPGNYGISDKVIRNGVLPAIGKAADESHATLIDLYALLSGKDKLFPDHVHPNAEGAGLIAAGIYHALTGKEATLADKSNNNR